MTHPAGDHDRLVEAMAKEMCDAAMSRRCDLTDRDREMDCWDGIPESRRKRWREDAQVALSAIQSFGLILADGAALKRAFDLLQADTTPQGKANYSVARLVVLGAQGGWLTQPASSPQSP